MWDKFKALFGLAKKRPLYIRRLKEQDLPSILAIEQQMYKYPWSEGIFKDCMSVGYSNWAYIKEGEFIGYAILSIAVGEAHLLNVCLTPKYQGQGLGKQFINELISVAKEKHAECLFLEVRPSNTMAVKLYETMGFKKIGQRKNYYPTENGKEDALVLSLDIIPKGI